MTANNTTIETGIEYENDVRDEDAEVYGFADNGEHAVVWAVFRSDEHYHANVYNCEAGLADDVHAFTVDADKYRSAEELAKELAEDDPKGSVEAAREYWAER